jgi:hypothetical protein
MVLSLRYKLLPLLYCKTNRFRPGRTLMLSTQRQRRREIMIHWMSARLASWWHTPDKSSRSRF